MEVKIKDRKEEDEVLVDTYLKSINSASNESLSVTENEAKKEVCYKCKMMKLLNCVGLCYDCDLSIHG